MSKNDKTSITTKEVTPIENHVRVVPRRATLQDWIADALADDDKEGPCTAIALTHKVGASGAEEEIHTATLKAEKPRTAAELQKLFHSKATTYAQNLAGVQTFMLRAFYAGKAEPQSAHPFTVAGAHEFAGGVTEGPDGRGQTQQAMRLTEALLQGGFSQISAVNLACLQQLDAAMRYNNELMAHNRELAQENRDAFTIVKDVIKMQVENQQAHEMRKLEFERATAERAKWMNMAPPMVNQALGKEVFPQAVADTKLIESLADALLSVPEDERAQSVAALSQVRGIGDNPILVATLMSRLAQHGAQRDRENEANAKLAEQLASTTPTPKQLAAEGVGDDEPAGGKAA